MRSPQPGEALVLHDQRRFALSSVDNGARGWWITARSADGTTLLQGNFPLEWDAALGTWRPEKMATPSEPAQRSHPTPYRRASRRASEKPLSAYDASAQEQAAEQTD